METVSKTETQGNVPKVLIFIGKYTIKPILITFAAIIMAAYYIIIHPHIMVCKGFYRLADHPEQPFGPFALLFLFACVETTLIAISIGLYKELRQFLASAWDEFNYLLAIMDNDIFSFSYVCVCAFLFLIVANIISSIVLHFKK